MPHKRNPIRSERLTGIARIVRGHAVAALKTLPCGTSVIFHSAVERVILPDTCILTTSMVIEITDLVKNLLVYPQNMERNMNCYGVLFSVRKFCLLWSPRV